MHSPADSPTQQLCSQALAVMQQHLPPGTQVWLFGSRATGRAWRGSDLDLLVDAGAPIPFHTLAQLKEALAESDLPVRVDVVDRQQASPAFLAAIGAQLQRLGDL